MSSRVHLFVVCMVVMVAFVAVSYLTDPADLRAQSGSRTARAPAEPRTPDALGRGGTTHVLDRFLASAARRQLVVDAVALFPEDLWNPQGQVVVDAFPLPGKDPVTLQLEPFEVSSTTRFVKGGPNGDQPLNLDAEIYLWRGTLQSVANSHAYLAFSDETTLGWISVGQEHFQVSSEAPGLQPGELVVFETPLTGLWPEVRSCGVTDTGVMHSRQRSDIERRARDMRHLQVAVDTDYDFYTLFGDLDAAATYLVVLYGFISDIYMRDLNIRLDLSYVRLIDNPADEWDFMSEEDPLYQFKEEWERDQSGVSRDVAQFLTGRRNLPYGGIAYTSHLCDNRSYSVCSQLYGAFVNPTSPNATLWDPVVVAHELGHNCGTSHTHSGYDPPIDECYPLPGVMQRGTLMSYCLLHNGSEANTDLRFHTRVQDVIDDFVGDSVCVVPDCNFNAVDDRDDILEGTSEDENTNGIPDECEDCNGNHILDDEDISSGSSEDDNANGIPDECEPDCDDNGKPDDLDIAEGRSQDAYGNGVPDDCEADCNENETSDYTEIISDMSLDINRNALLDSCEDCDSDGEIDAQALGGAHNIWVTSATQNYITEYHAASGVFIRNSVPGHVVQARDIVVTSEGYLLVSAAGSDRVVKFDGDGNFIDDFVAYRSGGLIAPHGLLFDTDGNLLVASRGTDSILTYDGNTGAYLGNFVVPGSGGLSEPHALVLGPNGNLFVSSGGSDEILEYDGVSGDFAGVFVAAGGGGVDDPGALTFLPNGDLLVASRGSDTLLAFDGITGASLGQWNVGGSFAELGGLEVGPSGHIFLSALGGDDEYHLVPFHTADGKRRRYFIRGPQSGLESPHGFAFVPGWDIDCNVNVLPDSCDIETGTSNDADGDGIPDECQVDCNDNGTDDRLDIIPFGTSTDCNANNVPDECDISSGASEDCDDDGRPDECAGRPLKLLPVDGVEEVRFGDAVALSGTCAVSGAPRDGQLGDHAGAAYVHRQHEGGARIQQAKLLAGDGAEQDDFGSAVAADGDYAVIGAPNDDDEESGSGSAYVFRHEEGAWTEEAKLLSVDAGRNYHFGTAVAIEGEFIVIGEFTAAHQGTSSGAAHVFRRNESAEWISEGMLLASDGELGDFFGRSVAIHGSRVVVGADGDDDMGSGAGAAYVFLRDDQGTWTEQAKLVAGDGDASDIFGASVAIEGDLVVAGARNADDQGNSSGAVYIFEHDGNGAWHEQVKLLASDGRYLTTLGAAVAIDGRVVAAGAPLNAVWGERSGSVYVFQETHAGEWIEIAKLVPHDGAEADIFGDAVDVDGLMVLGGSYGDDDFGSYSGSSYLFTFELDCNGNGTSDVCDVASGTSDDANGNGVPDECEQRCPGDANGDGVVDFIDIMVLLAVWGECPDCPEDLNGDGVIDFGDILIVLQHWNECE